MRGRGEGLRCRLELRIWLRRGGGDAEEGAGVCGFG